MAVGDVWPGNPYPLGATFDGGGINFAVFSSVATKIEICIFATGDGASLTGQRVDRTFELLGRSLAVLFRPSR